MAGEKRISIYGPVIVKSDKSHLHFTTSLFLFIHMLNSFSFDHSFKVIKIYISFQNRSVPSQSTSQAKRDFDN